MLFKRYTIRADKKPIRDKIRVRDGDAYIDLDICAAPGELVLALNHAQGILKGINADTPVETLRSSARSLATAVFGETQADALMKFYDNDAASVLEVCSRYFHDRLRHKLAKAQKRIK